MDSYHLIHRLPGLNGMVQQDLQSAAVECVATILDEIENERRQPDPWEAQEIICAIWFIGAQLYNTAFAYVRRALTPLEERPELYLIETPETVTIEHLRASLQRVGADHSESPIA